MSSRSHCACERACALSARHQVRLLGQLQMASICPQMWSLGVDWIGMMIRQEFFSCKFFRQT